MATSIKGLHKTSTVDFPPYITTTIFLSTCNFRCGFCHNKDIVNNSSDLKEYSEQEILEFLEKRKKLVDAVCITGGEPTLYPNLKDFIRKIKDAGFKIKLDTNGMNPEILKELIDENFLDYIAMDIKADKENYDKVAGTQVDLSKINQSIEIIRESDIDYEFRSTVIPSFFNEETIESIGIWLNGVKKYALQQFTSSTELLDTSFENAQPYDIGMFEKFRDILKEYIDEIELRV